MKEHFLLVLENLETVHVPGRILMFWVILHLALEKTIQ